MSTIVNGGRLQSGNATSLQSTPITTDIPVAGQVLKATAGGEWAPGVDSDSANAVTIQGRAMAATAPSDAQVIKWDNAGNTWKPGTDTGGGGDATSLQGRTLAATAPGDGNAIKWNAGASQWEPSPDNNSQDATHIRNIEVDTAAPTATNTTLVFDSAANKYVADLGAGVVSDGSRSYVKDLTQNLGVGTAGPGLSGKIHAYNSATGADTRILAESDSGHTSLHLRSDSGSTATVGDRYGQVQFWYQDAAKASLHYDPEETEIILNADSTANSARGLTIKEDGRTGFHTNDRVGNFTLKQVSGTAIYLGTDGANVTTTANSTKTITGSANANFIKDFALGDEVALSSAGTDFTYIEAIASATSMTVSSSVGDGTSQTIEVKRALVSFLDSSNNPEFVVSSGGKVGIGTGTPSRRLVVQTALGEGNCTIRASSPDDQAILSIRADSTGTRTSGGDRDPSINFKSGNGSGEDSRIRYVKDHESHEVSLTDSPTNEDTYAFQQTNRGGRFGVRQTRAISALSSKGLPTGELLGDDGLEVTATPDVSLQVHTVSANGDPFQRIAIGDRVAIQATLPAADSDYAYVSGVASSFFTTSTDIGVASVPNKVWLKPAHFRLEASTTTENVLVVDSESRVNIGMQTGGLDSSLNINGGLSLAEETAPTAPPLDDAGAAQDVTKLYFQKGNGNDDDMRCLIHFDEDGPHGFLSDSGFGSSQRHTITNKPGLVDTDGVVPDSSTTKFGSGSAHFQGDAYLNIDEMFGGGTDFDPNNAPGYSWSFWLNLEANATSTQPLTGVYNTASKWSHFIYDDIADSLMLKQDFGLGPVTSATIPNLGITTGGSPIGMGAWFYLAFVYERSSNKLYVFVNGVLVGSDTLTAAAPNAFSDAWVNSAIRIGFDEGYSSSKFKGYMDEVAFSSKVRHTTGFTNPSESFRATGVYAWHGGLSQPYRLQPVGA